MNREEDLVNAVIAKTKESDGVKELACANAFELARECQTEIIEIGRICNKQKIKIRKCQLGCF